MANKKQNFTLTDQLERAQHEVTLDTLGFICIDRLKDINGDVTEDENVWLWRNTEGMEISVYDEGEGKCSLVAILTQPKHKTRKKAYKNAHPNLVMN